MYAIFIPHSQLCWALGLSVSWLGDLCLALRLSAFCGTYVWHYVCLFVSWVTYVRHWVCLFVGWVTYVRHFVCLFVGWETYVRHWVCLFVDWVSYVGHWVCLFDHHLQALDHHVDLDTGFSVCCAEPHS